MAHNRNYIIVTANIIGFSQASWPEERWGRVTYEASATPQEHGLCCFHLWILYEARGNDAVPKDTVLTTLTCKPWC